MNNHRRILGTILIIILVLGFINNTNFRQTCQENFLVGNMGFSITTPKKSLADEDNVKTQTPIRDRIVYEGASTPFTPVGTVLSNNTGSFVYE